MTVLLELERVSKLHTRGRRRIRVLNDLSLTVCPGDFIAVHGAKNAGKSTLLKIASGLERADTGTVWFEGQDLSKVSARQLAKIHNRGLSWVDRGGPDREWTIADFVAMPVMYEGSRFEARQRALDCLEQVGILDCAGARWNDLGNHEQMLVALANAIVRTPKLLVMDDPTRGLDAVERDRVVQLIRSLATEAGVGILMAVPDFPAMLRATQMFTLLDGQLLGGEDPPGGDKATLLELPRAGLKRSA
jgi:ABC-type lipoprotein export system ATPase subunit